MAQNYVKIDEIKQCHDEEIWDCRWFSTNDDMFLTASLDNSVKIWRLIHTPFNMTDDENQAAYRTELVNTLSNHHLGVNSIDVSPDGKIIATRSLDSFIRFFSTDKENEQIRQLDCSPANSWTLEFFPCSKLLATGSMTGHIHVIRTESAEQACTLDSQLSFVSCIAISPQGNKLAASSMDGKVVIFEIKVDENDQVTGQMKFNFEAHAQPVRALCFNHDNSTIITGGDDGLIRLYSLEGKATVLLDTLCGHGGWILKLRKCPDNRHFVSTSADGKMKVWDILSRECVSTFTHSSKCWSADYNYRGDKLISVSADKSLSLYDCPTARED